MATTKVKSIKTSLDRTIKYILNPSKTENSLFTGGFNCVPSKVVAKLLCKVDCQIIDWFAHRIQANLYSTR